MTLSLGLLPVVDHLLDKSVVALAGGPVLVHPGLGGGLKAYGASVFQYLCQIKPPLLIMGLQISVFRAGVKG